MRLSSLKEVERKCVEGDASRAFCASFPKNKVVLSCSHASSNIGGVVAVDNERLAVATIVLDYSSTLRCYAIHCVAIIRGASRAAGQRHGGSRSLTQSQFVSPTSHEDVWVPPCQQLLGTRSNIFKIQNPEDLLAFISEDDRLCVIKVFATWCQTCKKIDLRYRKLASKFGDKYTDPKDTPAIKQRGKARFAELQYDNPQNQDLCDSVLRTTSFPYILMYKRQEGKIREFHCTPAKFQMLVDAVEKLAGDDLDGGVGVDDSFQKQVIDLGLADRR